MRRTPSGPRRRWLLAAAFLASWPGTAWPALITLTSDAFSGPFDVLSHNSFDPALGSLDRVDVLIQGTLLFNAVSAPNLVGPFGAPVPYGYTVIVEQDFSSISPNPGFDFASPARFQFSGTASGAGGALPVRAIPFSYDFSFTEQTDFLGFAIPGFSGATIPPVLVSGQREDFIEDPLLPGIPIQTSMVLSTSQLAGLPLLSTSPSASGAALIAYHYTPAHPEAVAEPKALALLALGLAGLGAAGRRGSLRKLRS